MEVTHTVGGHVDQTAVVGHAPEHRDWKPGDPTYMPILGDGVRVEAYVTIDAGRWHATYIGAGSWLMKHVHVGHDVEMGRGCEVSPGAVICGHAKLGDRVKVGVNASILPCVHVGTGARVGAGAVVTKNVPAGETWAGNPARCLRAADRTPELV